MLAEREVIFKNEKLNGFIELVSHYEMTKKFSNNDTGTQFIVERLSPTCALYTYAMDFKEFKSKFIKGNQIIVPFKLKVTPTDLKISAYFGRVLLETVTSRYGNEITFNINNKHKIKKTIENGSDEVIITYADIACFL